MLAFLHIQNLALMKETRLDLPSGFVAVTGETGAGKSVLLGALSLLAGNRAEKSLIRTGADTLTVEAILQPADLHRINQKLEDLELPQCEEGQLVLYRSLSRTKASKIRINGVLSTLSQLQEIGEEWIDFHGPGEPQKLFAESWQRSLLDQFAGNRDLLATYSTDFLHWKNLQSESENLRQASALSADEQEFLRNRIQAIDAVDLDAEKLAELEIAAQRMDSAKDILEISSQLESELAGEDGLTTSLAQLNGLASRLVRMDPKAADIAHRIESLSIEVDDLAAECSALAEEVDMDPAVAASIETRMDAWMELKRQYGPTMEAIQARRSEMAHRLESQSDIEGSLKRLDLQIANLERHLKSQASQITENRRNAAVRVAREVAQRLKGLGFRHPNLRIEIIPSPKLGPQGDSTVRIQFSPNPGQDLQPLNKIASSGELARVMLAIKTGLASADQTPVLVFDEVDANIGGEIAVTVGQQLFELGQRHQVFVITHLAQVAAIANHHFVVEKHQTSSATSVKIDELGPDSSQRIDEIARMLGDRDSAAAREHATTLIRKS